MKNQPPKDLRFEIVNDRIRDGKIVAFNKIFEVLPKTVMAQRLGTNTNRFSRLIENPEDLTVRELKKMAGMIGTTGLIMFLLIENQDRSGVGERAVSITAVVNMKRSNQSLNVLRSLQSTFEESLPQIPAE